MTRSSLLLSSALALLATTSVSSAHHSKAGFFDPNSKVEIEGIVARIQWRNPHIRFEIDVQDESRETVRWHVESGALGVLRAQGRTGDFVRKGDRVSILGEESLRDRPEIFAQNILLANGEEILLTLAASPHFSEKNAAVSRAIGSFDERAVAEARASADGVGIQVNDSTRAVRSATANATTSGISSWHSDIGNNPQAAELFAKGTSDPESLSPGELAQYFYLQHGLQLEYQAAFYLSEEGTLDAELRARSGNRCSGESWRDNGNRIPGIRNPPK